MLRLIDVAAIFDPNFEINQGFQSHWRSHGWDGKNEIYISGEQAKQIVQRFLRWGDKQFRDVDASDVNLFD